MKKMLFSLYCFFSTAIALAQYAVGITVSVKTAIPETDSLFIAGSFNNWNPSATEYKLQKQPGGKYFIRLKDKPLGNYDFKFTRGSWTKVECGTKGNDVANHSLNLSGDTNVVYELEAWKDMVVIAEIKHTSSPHVKIIDTAFVIPQLNRTRRIWIYLPKGYEQSKKQYPVMYLQDGQNVFDAATSFAGEWQADETMDSLVNNGTRACIMVAIDNGGSKRLNEYSLYDFRLNNAGEIKAEGDEYLEFLAKTLKPFIDKSYRTQKDKINTYIAGSSMGGLISFYALMKYPDLFGGAGVFSPSFQVVPDLNKLIGNAAKKVNAKIFFYAGGGEGESMVSLMDSVADRVGLSTQSIIYKVVDPEAKHNEAAWRKWFPEFYQWIIGEGYDGRIKAE
ncbi:MAG: alpha/beta hydrolase [Sphingobacteriales bacterium]